MAKRKKVFCEDRLSNLRDSMLTHILSFLPTKEAAKTSVLSKRWHYMWSSVPDVEFILNDSTDNVDLVHTVLSRRTADIRRFSLVLPQSWRGPPLTYHVDSWVESALQRNARHVKIEMQHDETEVVFLDALLNHELLESLQLDLFMPDSLLGEDDDEDSPAVELASRVRLTKLQVLDLRIHGKICGESLSRLVSNCPVLEELSLYGWFDNLDVSSCSLKKLQLVVEECSRLKIACPRLQYLKLQDDTYLPKGSEGSTFMEQVVSRIPNACEVEIHINNVACFNPCLFIEK